MKKTKRALCIVTSFLMLTACGDKGSSPSKAITTKAPNCTNTSYLSNGKWYTDKTLKTECTPINKPNTNTTTGQLQCANNLVPVRTPVNLSSCNSQFGYGHCNSQIQVQVNYHTQEGNYQYICASQTDVYLSQSSGGYYYYDIYKVQWAQQQYYYYQLSQYGYGYQQEPVSTKDMLLTFGLTLGAIWVMNQMMPQQTSGQYYYHH